MRTVKKHHRTKKANPTKGNVTKSNVNTTKRKPTNMEGGGWLFSSVSKEYIATNNDLSQLQTFLKKIVKQPVYCVAKFLAEPITGHRFEALRINNNYESLCKLIISTNVNAFLNVAFRFDRNSKFNKEDQYTFIIPKTGDRSLYQYYPQNYYIIELGGCSFDLVITDKYDFLPYNITHVFTGQILPEGKQNINAINNVISRLSSKFNVRLKIFNRNEKSIVPIKINTYDIDEETRQLIMSFPNLPVTSFYIMDSLNSYRFLTNRHVSDSIYDPPGERLISADKLMLSMAIRYIIGVDNSAPALPIKTKKRSYFKKLMNKIRGKTPYNNIQ